MQEVAAFAISQGGKAVIEELPSWYQFFSKYVTVSQSVRGILHSYSLPSFIVFLCGVMTETPFPYHIIYLQAVGGQSILGTRLITTSVFEDESSSEALVDALVNTDDLHIAVGTPVLYNATANSTSCTPAWYKSLWTVRPLELRHRRYLY